MFADDDYFIDLENLREFLDRALKCKKGIKSIF